MTIIPRGKLSAHQVEVTLSVIPRKPEDRSEPRLRWLLHDITARKQLETARLDHYFHETFERAAVGMVHIDVQGHLLRVNASFCDLLGYTRDELQSMSFGDLIAAEDMAVSTELHHPSNGEPAKTAFDVRLLVKTGVLVWTQATLAVVRNAAGNYAYGIVVIIDVTESRRLLAVEQAQVALAEALRETLLTLTGTLDYESVLNQILLLISRIFSQEAISIITIEGEQAHIVRSYGYKPEVIPELETHLAELRSMPGGKLIFEQVRGTRQPFIVSGIRCIRVVLCRWNWRLWHPASVCP